MSAFIKGIARTPTARASIAFLNTLHKDVILYINFVLLNGVCALNFFRPLDAEKAVL